MIERFNFYDIYGYLVPGLVLLSLGWLPFLIQSDRLPSSDIGAAVGVVLIAYLLGHLLQLFSKGAFPSKRITRSGSAPRYPSDYLLDAGSRRGIDPRVRDSLKNSLGKAFSGNPPDIDDGDLGARERARGVLFEFCRQSLVGAGRPHYVEQFEGLYAMMRGVCGAASLGAAGSFGWLLARLFDANEMVARIVVVALVILGSVFLAIEWMHLYYNRNSSEPGWWKFWALVAGWLLANLAFGARASVSGSECVALLGAVLGCLLLAIHSWSSYRYFAEHWARTVYNTYHTALSNELNPRS